jgi:hypothetical protein
MSNRFPWVWALLWTAGAAVAQPAPTPPPAADRAGRVPCLHYEPALVRLSGVLEKRTFPGSPGFGASTDKSDKSETAWVLRLVDAICTTGPGDVNPSERDVREVQLVARGNMLTRFQELAGKGVSASGTLFHAQSGHHHTKVLMAVQGLVAHELPPWAPQTRSQAPGTGGALANPPASLVTPTPEIPEHVTDETVNAVVAQISAKISPSAARELAGLQEHWRELAERDCRWETSLSQGRPSDPDAYASCIDRARKERIRRLRSLLGP